MSLKLSVIIIQMFAAIFMSLTYFRSKSGFLDICEKNIYSEINKTKISLVKTITREHEIKAERGRKDTIKLLVITLIFLLLIFFFKFTYLEYILTLISPNKFIPIMLLTFVTLFSYYYYLIMKKSELFGSILILKGYKIFYNILYLVSKKGYISGLGFMYLFSSFVFNIAIEIANNKADYFKFIEMFAMFYTIIGLATLGLIIRSYYQAKYIKG